MKKISKFLKGTVLSVMSLCMVFGIVYNVKDGETLRVNADTTSKVYSNEYYTLSYADGEVKFLLSTKVLDYEDLAHKLTEVELAELKDAIISVGYDVMLEGLDFATKFGSSLISRHSANIIDGSQVDITTVTDVIIGQLSDEEAIANALASQGTYDTLLEFYVDRYVSAYEAAGGNGDEAYAGISADLTSAIETAVDQAGLTDVPGFTSTDISSKVDTLVTNAKENEISLNLDEVADVVNLLEDKSVVVDVIKELEIESEVKDIVVTATADQAVNFLTSVDMDTIIEVFNNVSMEKEDVKTVINNVGVDNLVNVVDQIGIDKVKDLANAVDFTKEDLQETITENLTNISITSLLTAIKSINIDGHPLYADKKIQLGGFEAVLRSLPRPSEIATWTDEQMSLTWNLEVETVFGSADLDFTFGFKDDCSKIRSAASKIAEYASFDIVDGVVNVELTTPAKFSDVLLRVANTGHLSDGKKLFVFDNLFDTTLDDVYNKLSDKTYEDYLNLLKDVDYQVIVENVYNAENLNRIFKTEKFTDARLDRMVDEVANFVSHASTITYDRVKSFVGRYYDISALDDTAVETLINKTHELLVKIDSKKFDSALLREFIDPNSEYTSDNIDRYIDKLAKYEDYFNTVMDYVERGYNAAPDRFKDNTVMDFYKGDGTFNYEGAFSLNFEKVLTKLSSTHGSDIYNALEKVLSAVPSSIEVNLTLNLTDIHSVTYNIGSETRVGLLPEGADLEFFADATEVEGYTIHGWVDAQGTQYTSMPNFDVELFPILHSFEVSINEGVEKTYDGVAYTLEATTTPAGNGFGYQWFKDGVAIEGATEATYSVVNVADSGEYYCSVSYYEVTNVTETVSVVITPAVIDLTAWSWTNNGPFTYDGTEKSVALVTPEAYAELVANGTLVEKVEGNVATDADSYTATVVVTTTSTNYTLEGETSSEAWVINPAVVDLTAWSWTNNGPFTYDGTEKSVTLVTPEAYAELVANGTLVEAVEGNVATNAGSYTATVVVTTTSTNYALEGETSSEAWVINQVKIVVSGWAWIYEGPFTYDGTEKSVALDIPAEYKELINVAYGEEAKGTAIGTYTATATVTAKDVVNYLVEGTIADLAWEIKEKEILPPSFTLSIEGGVSEVYDVNKTHTLTVTANGDEAYTYTYQWFKDGVAIAGATQSTYTVSVVADSGEYYCVVSVDGTVEETDKVTVEITVKDLDLSQLALDDASHEYTGSQIEVSVLNLDLHADYLALSITQNSTLAASEIGSYDVFVAYSLLNTVDEESVRIVRNGEEQVGIITLTWEIKSNGDGPIIPGGETTKEFVYNENGISIKVSSEQELDADFELKVETVAVFDSELGTVLKAYDIKFLDGANAATLPENNKYTVTIALESAIAAKANLFIIYHPTSGADEKIDATVANGEITFETTHFSIYAVAEPTQEPENPPVKDPVEPKEQPSWWVWVLMGLSVIIIVLLLILILRKREPVVVPVVAEPTVAELSYIVVNENGVELVKLSEAEQEDILSEVPTNEHTIGTVEDEKVTIFKAPRQLRTAIGKIKDYNGNLSILVHRKPYKVVEKLFADQAQDNGEENVQVEVGQIAENDEKVIVKIFKNPRKVD
ncbi:immunoglobulin domain-containing protein [bacterium]|nr:immunoglobulin domain-containing protein [bacterium]